MKINNFCGIDIGCTNIKMMSIVNGVQTTKTVPSGDNFTREQLIKEICEFYLSFNHKFNGLGIAFSGGTSDFQKVDFTTLQCLKNLKVSDFSELTSNVKLINDSNATALAGLVEYPDSKVLVSITNGTGIGLGICIYGKLFTGSSGYLGEIYGNPTITKYGQITKIGKLCSGSKILKMVNSEEESYKQIITDASTHLGLLLADVIHMYNPDVIYLSGGAFSYKNLYEDSIKICQKYAYKQLVQNVTFAKSSFGSYSGCIGAMKLVSDY